MRHRKFLPQGGSDWKHPRSLVFIALMTALMLAVILLVDSPPLSAQIDPKQLQQTVDAAVGQLFTQTIQAAFNAALTGTAQADTGVVATATSAAGANPTATVRIAGTIPTAVLLATNTPAASTPAPDTLPFIQEFNGVPMVYVPAGCFLMGSSDEEIEREIATFTELFGEDQGYFDYLRVSQSPQHEICFERPFWIDQFEVTNEQFTRFGGLSINQSQFSDPDHPREMISWDESRAFCAFREARLPSEAEWEYAARGPDSLRYPWGNELDPALVVFQQGQEGSTAPVGSIPEGASWVGAMDMAGNVWEWTTTIFDLNVFPYPYQFDDGRDDLLAITRRVLRGGSWLDINPNNIHMANRGANTQDDASASIDGFRCMREDI